MTLARLRTITLAIGLLAVSTFWAAYADNASVKAQRSELLNLTAMPILLNGFRFHLGGGLRFSLQSPDPTTLTSPVVVFATADSCAYSKKVVPQWIDWIRNSTPTQYTALIASYEGTEQLTALDDALSQRTIPHALYQIVQRQRFTFDTGITSTPQLVVLDADGRARFFGNDFETLVKTELEKVIGRIERKALTF